MIVTKELRKHYKGGIVIAVVIVAVTRKTEMGVMISIKLTKGLRE